MPPHCARSLFNARVSRPLPLIRLLTGTSGFMIAATRDIRESILATRGRIDCRAATRYHVLGAYETSIMAASLSVESASGVGAGDVRKLDVRLFLAFFVSFPLSVFLIG